MTKISRARSAKQKLIQDLRDKSPDIPKDTCPVIDNIKSLIGDLEDHFENEEAECFGATADLLRSYLEHLRFCNSKLRDSGRFWYRASCDLLGVDDIYEKERF